MKFKRILGLVLAVLMVMSSFTLGIAAEQVPQDTKSTTINYGTPVVDGQIDEIWETAVEVDFPYDRNGCSESNMAVALETPVDHWAKALWDNDNLYVCFYVVDDNVYVGEGGLYYYDGVEVYFDEAHHNDYSVTGLRQPNVTATGVCNKTAEVSAYAASIGEGYYVVEVALPWVNVIPENDMVIGYDVSINGNNGEDGKRANCWSWNDRTNMSYAYSCYLGEGVLAGKPADAPSAVKYNVTYNANGGVNAPAGQIKNEGKSLTLTSEVPTRSFYEFKGWATSADSTEVVYAPGAEYTADENVELFAVWALAIDTSNRTLPEGAEVKAEGWVLDKVDGAVKETQVKWEIYTLDGDTVLNFTVWPEETDKVATSVLAAVVPENGNGIGYAQFGQQSWAAALTGEVNDKGESVTYRHKVTKVVIGDGITQIRGGAFGGMSNVATVEFPATLVNLDGVVFESSRSLSSIYVAGNEPVAGELDLSNVTNIPSYCFDGCNKVKSVKLNENYAGTISTETFKSTVISEVELPAGVTKLANKAFSGVAALTKVVVNGMETVIERYAFANGTDPEKVTADYIGQITIYAPAGSVAEAFCTEYADTGVKFVELGTETPDEPDVPVEPEEPEAIIPEIPEMSAESITGDFAEKNDLQWKFDPTTGLFVIFGNDTVLEMDYPISWNGKHEKDTDGDGVKEVLAVLPWLSGGDVTKGAVKEVIIAAPITRISNYMLAHLPNVAKITLPSTVKDLWNGALSYSNSLTTVVVAGNEAVEGVIDLSTVTNFAGYALDDAFQGQSVKILTGEVKSFEATKFAQKCKAVEIVLKAGTPLSDWATKYKNGEVTLSNEKEGKLIFDNIVFTYEGETPEEPEFPDEPDVPVEPEGDIVTGNITGPYSDNLWEYNKETKTLTITANKTSGWNELGTTDSTKYTDNWGEFHKEMEKVVIIGNISKISGMAFSGATNLKEVVHKVAQIDSDAFYNCPNLETVSITGQIAIPGVLDFSSITGNGKGGSCFTSQIFNGETKAKAIILSNTYKDEDGFRLKASNLPTNIQAIYGATEYLAAFAAENGLEFVPFGKADNKMVAWTIEDGVLTVMGEGAIENINVPEIYAADVTSVVIPASVTELADGAFAALTALENAQFKGNAPAVAEGAKPFGEQSDDFVIKASAYAEGFAGETEWCGYALELKEYIGGDVYADGTVDIRDAVLLAQYLAEWDVEIDVDAADCNGDGEIDVKDVVLLAQYLAHWNVELAGPSAPTTPDEPDTPDTPDTPVDPDTPDTPADPEDPEDDKYGDNEVEAGDAI